MSCKGNCWHNAVMEGLFLSLKTERVWQRDYANRAEAITDIADYIVGFYNSVRCTPNWATCHPKPLSSNRQSNNPSSCPEKLYQHTFGKICFTG